MALVEQERFPSKISPTPRDIEICRDEETSTTESATTQSLPVQVQDVPAGQFEMLALVVAWLVTKGVVVVLHRVKITAGQSQSHRQANSL